MRKRKRKDYANIDPDRSTDPRWIKLKSPCCGCHPQAHDPAIGCMMCHCREGIRDERWIFEEEFSTLVPGSTLALFLKAMRALGVTWDHDLLNGHRAIHSEDFVKLAHQVRGYMELQREEPVAV